MAARRRAFRAAAVLTLALAAAAAAGCGGDDDTGTGARKRAQQTVTVWVLENQPDRVRATIANVAALTRATGIKVRIVGIGDDQLASRVEQARAGGALPDVVQLPLDSAHAYARDGILDTSAAEEVVRQLREETFSQTALRLVSREGGVVAVPSDGWGQLLIYRKDLFRAAGLAEPRTLDDVRRAATRLHRDGRRGCAQLPALGLRAGPGGAARRAARAAADRQGAGRGDQRADRRGGGGAPLAGGGREAERGLAGGVMGNT